MKRVGKHFYIPQHPLGSVAAMLSCSLPLCTSLFDPNLSAVSFPQGSATLALLSPAQPVLQDPSRLIRQPPACQHSQSPGLSPVPLHLNLHLHLFEINSPELSLRPTAQTHTALHPPNQPPKWLNTTFKTFKFSWCDLTAQDRVICSMKCFRKWEGKSFGAGQRARGVGAGGEETWLRTALSVCS